VNHFQSQNKSLLFSETYKNNEQTIVHRTKMWRERLPPL
jgi:hypothetical protein